MELQLSPCRLLVTALLLLSSRTARSEEDRDTLWDAWGSWSECSRTCGGGASYSLRRCLSSKTCEGQNIKYRTCSNVDCPPDAGDFRAQQCSAHADVRYQGQFHEWLPVYNDPDNPCSLKCRAKASGHMVELAPKVLDGTRCYTESLDMCISGVCQIVGCDHELGSTAKEDNCGICNGDGSSCRLVRGHYKSQHASGKTEDTVVNIPFKSRHVRLVLKGPDHLYVESKTLQGEKSELILDKSGQFFLDNTTLDYQRFSDKEILRMTGPLGADFTVKVQLVSGADSVVQYIYYQPIIHRWRETDFFPCSVTCGGGYQLTSAECFDLRSGHVVVDQYCLYYPENVKPLPKLQECNMELCLDSDGYKEIMPYDLYHPLPRWESSPWTACSTSCGGGIQSRSVSCIEEDMQGTITPTEEWKCLYASKMSILQPCNTFDCPSWIAQEWSPCTVTCGQGLRYRVVLCIDHRGVHAGGCNPATKPHIKEDCLVTVPCYKSIDTLPVEAKPAWHKQAIELEEVVTASEEPTTVKQKVVKRRDRSIAESAIIQMQLLQSMVNFTVLGESLNDLMNPDMETFIPGPWQPCSRTCGAGTQQRAVKCQVLLSFSQTVADLPDDECEGVKPASSQPCYRTPCPGGESKEEEKRGDRTPQKEELHDWEYEGFTECSESCGGGMQEAVVKCLNKQTGEAAEHSLCVSSRRPPQLLQDCQTQPCPPRWKTGEWSSCSATCGVGLMTRTVACTHRPFTDTNRTVILGEEDCLPPKPSPVQACNRFDCPPLWDLHPWGQCSQSCAGGVQRRRVLCKQRLADGSVLELPDSFCPSRRPPSQQQCGNKDCPPHWITTDWSQCSVTCGHGIQAVQAVCRKQGANGQYSTVDLKNCSKVAKPSRFRPCFPGNCEDSLRPNPTVLPLKKVNIQWRKAKRVHLVVGGYAYLLPWSTLVLRCPSGSFRKGHIRWLKDGKPLMNLSVTSQGYMKIQQVQPSDAGVYTCVTGQAQEHFVLLIIGSKQKLFAPESLLLESRKNRRPASPRGGPQELPVSLNRYDNLVGLLLGLKNSFQNEKYVASKPHWSQMNRSTDGRSSEFSIPVLLTADSQRLDEVMRDISEGRRGAQAERLVAQLLNELIATQGDTNESTLHPTERATSSTEGPLVNKPTIKAHTFRAKSPVIIQRPKKVGSSPTPESVVYVGAPVMLQKPFATLELRCEALGEPHPSVTWSKNGKEVQLSSRVDLLPSGSLRIQYPSKGDEGLYTCTARNHLGSTSLSSYLQITSGKGKSCVHSNRTGGSCSERSNSNQSAELCAGQGCHLRWRLDAWSSCSASCGGGSQTRRIRCLKGPIGRLREVEVRQCLLAGRRPTNTRLCNVVPCARWATTSWGLCHGQCVGSSLATQHRHVYCQNPNGTKVSSRMCSAFRRPSSVKNCSTEACALRWHVGAWTQCTATCGRHGFQSRLVTCKHHRTGKTAREHHCMWRPRPSSWQRCNILSCSRRECQDSTRYCEKVRQLELCPLPQFKRRCCVSCQNT